ncbi:hypothetical protein [Odoribacter splanchnicus]|uniref:hypothetical protein n=1 Tax=Odoribacter splanchnicus TaxID=28118 RepID=UPI001899E38E|nr:hypothetical protein [Odoribacter splanchnicus]MDB9209680.1 hypothetical protein [Odoribacter splanchnicus]MDB9225394.1 hypothetical protein [Odoribacter splanchnicus]MDB9237834.1 hypothetical protein [Odoribacter splanchnicus]MDB9241791.1 hypothetical protein [Odoribacter splanchnicus]HJG19169.1 hypothetical protein [Odoribacter splanchnicus]
MKAQTNDLFKDFSGSTGGITATHSGGHLVVRNKIVQTYTDTEYQKAIRQNFTLFTKNWQELTDVQREEWNAKAKTVTSDHAVYGISGKISGFNLYVRCNMNLQLVGLAPALTVPGDDLPGIVPELSAVTIDADALNVTLSDNVDKDDILVIRLTTLSPGQSTNTNALRQVGQVPGNAKEADIIEKYTAIFGLPEDGQKIQVQIYAINKNSGFASSRKLSVTNLTKAAEQPAE